ncbi:hypothetical protein PWG71_19300 [Nocardiopsis sp. N85]|uniref:hypothetical protein n=1 Tax=Nocardiopsis sp. N85 TaxID=3029400 RepID=UPI00237F0C39|nr:hypothetical protein [Nocardiopsis sp. N85]MDE3723542.1 hypothetical protein [Nocardiopsis sp. N85]
MSSDGVGANWAAMGKAEQAEALAEAMVGLEETFELLIGEIAPAAGPVEADYHKFKENLQPEIRKVQWNGLALADDIQAGASEIARNDYESSEEYRGAWGEIPKVNFF